MEYSTQAVKREIYLQGQDKLLGDVLTTKQFSEIYEQYFDRVYKYIYYRIQNQYEAEDICSHVFEKVISNYHKFCEEKAKFDVWLFAIVRNTVTDFYRARKKRFHFSLDSVTEFIFPKPSPEELAIRDDVHQALFQALAKLRDKERNIIALKFAAGLKNSEIAELLGKSESNIGVVVHRSLRKLQKILETGGLKDE
ncbi:RNA polymerase sigma-70 factor, ECF subfamily [Paenibacillus sp. UNCCL117]|uniref:sigma-70 family RNA polymerase sigma factor n=1 Tax=unclassified Paenibacillus TaxID=185978 RepID=UPI00088895B0|nr:MULTISPECIES: sigma-70 family RNA polymerase sigma factor [unclassified Paenibacillus]SDD86563.1 RNA polymerase sigma-70 factor, ECF subfamily [Paenibacillus sp. cl123]SFW54133.1 RNA polymerase sigma-70 factor, ECF subfamily [Paenibacillus sp. UNCCL117]